MARQPRSSTLSHAVAPFVNCKQQRWATVYVCEGGGGGGDGMISILIHFVLLFSLSRSLSVAALGPAAKDGR